jgi:hypothetical protein
MGMRFRMDKCWYLVVWKIGLEFWGGYTAMVGIEMVVNRVMSTSMLRGLKVERRSESGGAARKVEGRVVGRWYKGMLVDPSIWLHEGIRFPFAQRAPRCVLAWMSTQLSRPANIQTQSAALGLYAAVIKARIGKDR